MQRMLVSGGTTPSSSQCNMKLPFDGNQLKWLTNLNPVCQINFPNFGTCSSSGATTNASGSVATALKTLAKSQNLCFGGKCCIPVEGVVDACFGANFCAPGLLSGVLDGANQICVNPKLGAGSNPLTGAVCGSVGVLGNSSSAINSILQNAYIGADLSICLAPQLLKHIPGHPSICINLVTLNYMYLEGLLDVGGSISAVLFKASAKGTFKVNDAPAASWACGVNGIQCNDFCIMQNGQHYSTFQLQVFGFFKYFNVPGSPWEVDKPTTSTCPSTSGR